MGYIESYQIISVVIQRLSIISVLQVGCLHSQVSIRWTLRPLSARLSAPTVPYKVNRIGIDNRWRDNYWLSSNMQSSTSSPVKCHPDVNPTLAPTGRVVDLQEVFTPGQEVLIPVFGCVWPRARLWFCFTCAWTDLSASVSPKTISL